MRALAERLAPGDLRPLRQPDRVGRMPRQLLGPAAAMLVVAVLASGLMIARNVIHARASGNPAGFRRVPADPDEIAVIGASSTELGNSIKLISVTTGRVIQTVSQPTDSNGLALSPDGKSLFVVAPRLKLRQISLTTGKSSYLAAGAYPAVSPDGRYVAYATGGGFTQVAIRNLGTGATRSVSLTSLIGVGSSLLNQGGLTWLGDGRTLVAVAEPDPIAAVARVWANPGWSDQLTVSRHATCGQQDAKLGLCVVVIQVAHARLAAHPIYVTGLAASAPVALLSGDLAARQAFFIAQTTMPVTVVSRVSLGRRHATVSKLVPLPAEALAVAMAPAGDRVLYLTTSEPAKLDVATVSADRLTKARVLLTDTRRYAFSQAAW